MRPLNTRERRVQFFRFLAFFLLAVAPFVVLTWLLMRVDHVENEYLRSQYSGKVAGDEVTKLYTDRLIALGTEVADIKKFVVSSSGNMEKFNCRESGELNALLGELENARLEFKEVGRTLNDSILDKVSSNLYETTKRFVAIYDKTCMTYDEVKTKKDEFEKNYKTADQDLQMCKNALSACQLAR